MLSRRVTRFLRFADAAPSLGGGPAKLLLKFASPTTVYYNNSQVKFCAIVNFSYWIKVNLIVVPGVTGDMGTFSFLF